jgi:hypothetical protein
MEASRHDLAFEATVLRHPDAFRPETVDQAALRDLFDGLTNAIAKKQARTK